MCKYVNICRRQMRGEHADISRFFEDVFHPVEEDRMEGLHTK